MLKKSTGNMYPWVTHTKSYLAGQCPHDCSYCYVQALQKRYPNNMRYSGPLELVPAELEEDLGSNRTIFIEHMNDLFAQAVPDGWIRRVIAHTLKFNNRYVFQTKNPARTAEHWHNMTPDTLLGTTIETNRHLPEIMRDSPDPKSRHWAMLQIPRIFRIFVTVEPILDFDLDILSHWLIRLQPAFINIGADSKGRGLPEPEPKKIGSLIRRLEAANIEVRLKTNLTRLVNRISLIH